MINATPPPLSVSEITSIAQQSRGDDKELFTLEMYSTLSRDQAKESAELLTSMISISGLDPAQSYSFTDQPTFFDLTVNESGTHQLLLGTSNGSISQLGLMLLDNNGNPVVPDQGWPTGQAEYAPTYSYNLDPNITYQLGIKATCLPNCNTSTDHALISLLNGNPNTTIHHQNLSVSTSLPVTRLRPPALEQINYNSVSIGRSTGSEVNCDYFEPQYFDDNKTWQSAEKVQGAGTSQTQRDYTTTIDISSISSETLQIRIKQVDFDGRENYSEISSLKLQHPKKITTGPNPASDLLNVFAPGEIESITIWNNLGQKVYEGRETQIPLGHYPSGLYSIKIIDNQGNKEKTRFIKQ